MKYNFLTTPDRRGMDALALDGTDRFAAGSPKEGFDIIPMWIADMNFETVPTIPEAITERVRHPLFGYFNPREEYFDSIIRWHSTRYGTTGLSREAIGHENGVLGGVASAVTAILSPGSPILLHSPTYVGFTHTLEDNGYPIIHSPLKKDAEGIWRMDYEDMDRKLKENHIHLAIFCSPHNPAGRVWEREELEKALEVYRENDCTVISDEIWADITLGGRKHIPTQMVNEWARQNVIAFYAPSKTFNLAGLVGSYHVIYNARLRDLVTVKGLKTRYNEQNVLSMHALLGAYKPEGYEWVTELCQVLTENIDFVWTYIHEHFKGLTAAKPQGTYMLYINCEAYCREKRLSMEELLRKGWDVGVMWQDGRPFGDPWGIRMNCALPLSRLEEAMRRLITYVFPE